MAEGGFTVVILAAQRGGRIDPLAAAAGVTHKALVPIMGRPLLAHVLDGLAGVEGIAGVRIVIEPGAEAALAPVVEASGRPVTFIPAADNIAESVYAAAAGLDGPLVITTADNVLLTPAALREVAARLARGDDAVITLTRRESVLAAHPAGQRRFHKLRDGQFSNCNLYGLSQRGLKFAEIFRGGGQFAKHPMRLVRAIGLLNLIILRYGLITVEGGTKRLGKRFGIRFSAIVLDDGSHAIDVDNGRTYAIAEDLLKRRAAGS